MNDSINLTVVNILLLIASVGGFVVSGIGVTKRPRSYADWALFLVALAVLVLVLLRF